MRNHESLPFRTSLPPAEGRKFSRRDDITAKDLIVSVTMLLNRYDIQYGRIEYQCSPSDKDGPGCVEVQLMNVVEHGTNWDLERYISFSFNGNVKSLNGYLEDGGYHMKIIRTRTQDEIKNEVSAKTMFDVVARLGADRTVTFLPVKERRFGEVIF
jgi:hypothetical protein